MNKKCPRCDLGHSGNARTCVRCRGELPEVSVSNTGRRRRSLGARLLRRALVCILVIILSVGGFYYSLIYSSEPLTAEQWTAVDKAIGLLEEKGFIEEAFYLRHLTAFRSNDHWLNASVPKENAYAATNYPFEIMTLYPDFFAYTSDTTERAAILLHEARHLKGHEEREAYEYVWKNKKKLGWTRDSYGDSVLWNGVRQQTAEYAPGLFICTSNPYNDCTE